MVNVFTESRIGEHGYLFSGMKKLIRLSQLRARVKAGGSVMDEQKVVPNSLPENRYPCSF